MIHRPRLRTAADESCLITEQIRVSAQQAFPEGRANPETQATSSAGGAQVEHVQEELEEETCWSYQRRPQQ